VLVPVIVAWPFVSDMIWPSQQRRMVELEGPFRGLALALSSSFMFTGMSFGSALGGRAYAAGGRTAVLGITLALLSLGLASLAYSRKAARRPAAEGPRTRDGEVRIMPGARTALEPARVAD
jgi:predicted MFS family arabinose efflux permease